MPLSMNEITKMESFTPAPILLAAAEYHKKYGAELKNTPHLEQLRLLRVFQIGKGVNWYHIIGGIVNAPAKSGPSLMKLLMLSFSRWRRQHPYNKMLHLLSNYSGCLQQGPDWCGPVDRLLALKHITLTVTSFCGRQLCFHVRSVYTGEKGRMGSWQWPLLVEMVTIARQHGIIFSPNHHWEWRVLASPANRLVWHSIFWF